MLRILLISFFVISIHASSEINTYPIDSIEPACMLNDGSDILNQKQYKYELTFNNKTYIKQLFKKISSTSDSRTLKLSQKKPYKRKWIKAFFTISSNEKSCRYKAKITIIGDMIDHLEFNAKSIEHSLLIRLDDSNIDGNTEFRLFVSKAREEDNELFGALIYKKLGFLAPRTYKIPISVNGIKRDYIFQEEINKEFLENNNRSEGLIFEGNEKLGLGLPMSLARIVNSSWSVQSTQSKLISLYSLDRLNQIYLSSASDSLKTDPASLKKDPPLNVWSLKERSKTSASIDLLKEFYALSYAMNGVHGLSKDDSRFYFNSVYGNFEPIYYDQQILIHKELKFETIDRNTKAGLKSIQKKLNNINKDSLYKELLKNGFLSNRHYFDEIIKNLNSNIIFLQNIKVLDQEYSPAGNKELINFANDNKNFGNFIQLNQDNFLEMEICNKDLKECEYKDINDNNLEDILSQKILIDGLNFSMYVNVENLENKEYPLSIYSLKKIEIENDVYLRYTDNIDIFIDKNKRIINITTNNTKKIGRAIFHSGKLSKWSIFFNGNSDYFSQQINSRFSLNGLTGCLSFHDIELDSVDIEIKNTNCEDALHLLRAHGNINTLKINNSEHDAIDFDFSNIRLQYAEIFNAKNDCIDLSSGTYHIDKIYLDICGDKGISVGEKSKFTNLYTEIYNSFFGVAVKDSSTAIFKIGIINSSASCISAYRKKQEFNGAKVKVGNIKCEKPIFFSTPDSMISL